MSREVILTGLRSNSDFHIGNYLGAILPMVQLQKDHSENCQINMFVPDLHSFTTPVNHSKLYEQTLTNIKYYVAAGLDLTDNNTYIYRQSYISAHSELAWILSCFTYVGELNRMTQFKEKSTKTTSAGLLIYPVLMSADILLYDASWVPVGDDQRQHLELARDLALRLNNKFGDVFTVPYEWEKQLALTHREHGVRIRSLRNPKNKMSKSIQDPNGTIMLSDKPEEAAKKIITATTDSLSSINYDWDNQPGISNLLLILALLTNTSVESLLTEWKGKSSYGDLKATVADEVKKFLTQLQLKLNKIDETSLTKKLAHDEDAMRSVAIKKLEYVQKVVGIRPK